MVDRERILAKLEQLEEYLRELREILPPSFEEYLQVERKRACERLLQISIEAALDICHMFVRGLRLGIPAEEDDVFEKLVQVKVLSQGMAETLRKMKGLRNILVHEYGRVDDHIVYMYAQKGVSDFLRFKAEVLAALGK